MFSKVDLVFPMPNGRGEEYLTEVLQHRSDHLKAIAGAADPVSDTYGKYLSLIKRKAPMAEIEGIAQLIRYLECQSKEDQTRYIKNAPMYRTGQLVRIGTLYFDKYNGESNKCYMYKDGEISIVDTVKDKELQFIFVVIDGKQLLVSNRNVLSCISWNNLNEQGLITGKQISIDGQNYILRVLTGGKTEQDANEWDAIMHEIGASNDIWHWEKCSSWCQEASPESESSYHVLRGGMDPWGHRYVRNDASNEAIAWRPVLELL